MTWLTMNWQQVVGLIWAHLALSVPAIAISVVVAIPIGRLAYRKPAIGGSLLSITSLLYAIPALPVLIIIPAVFGFSLRSSWTMIIALSVYGVALMVRSAADAFGAVDQKTRDAAVAVGYSPRSIFWTVDLPLATPVLLSGLRVVTVSTIGLVTIGALIGIPSLGSLLTDGFQRGIPAEVVTGLLCTFVLALLLDALLLVFGRAITPWNRRPKRVAHGQEALA